MSEWAVDSQQAVCAKPLGIAFFVEFEEDESELILVWLCGLFARPLEKSAWRRPVVVEGGMVDCEGGGVGGPVGSSGVGQSYGSLRLQNPSSLLVLQRDPTTRSKRLDATCAHTSPVRLLTNCRGLQLR